MSRHPKAWRRVAGTVLVWEALAWTGRVPFITDMVRQLPRWARVSVVAATAVAIWDHFHPNGRLL